MIRLEGVTLSRGGRVLLDRASASIAPGERIALIGRNGSGKTTLLAALAGEVLPDEGNIEQPWRATMRLEQSLPSSPLPAWRFLVDSDEALAAATAALAEAGHDADGIAIAIAHESWLDAGGASAEARARTLLAGLGFDAAQADTAVDALSGGWRMRLNLARALFAPSELLLLDEPTNHLDLDAILWLERWLLRYAGTIVVVSHDRDFLDRVASATLHLDEARLVRYAGGYSAFERLRAQRRMQVERERASQQQRIDHLNAFIERFRAKATKARQVQSRIKALERMAEVAPVRELRGIDFPLQEVGETPDPMLRAEALDAGYGAQAVLRGVDLTIRRAARIGVLGRNGAGKSTLVRTLVGELEPLAGEVLLARGVRIGYFAQQGIDALHADDTPLQRLQRSAPAEREQVLRDYLGRFGFSGVDATRPIGPMSGGEKARLLLALTLQARPQMLVLDEPTNHLDAQARDALADALAEFDGALLLVSHDRYLLRSTVDSFVLVADGRVEPFDGDLDDYASWLLQRPAGASSAGAGRSGRDSGAGASATIDAAAATASKRDERRSAARRRAQLAERLRPFDEEIAAIERRLDEITARIEPIEARLAEPDAYRDAEGAGTLARERATLQRERDSLEEHWIERSTARDAEREAFERGDDRSVNRP